MLRITTCLTCGAGKSLELGAVSDACAYCGGNYFSHARDNNTGAHEPTSLLGLALIHEVDERWHDALNAWNQLIEQNPAETRAWLGKGVAESMLKNFSSWAVDDFRSCMRRARETCNDDHRFADMLAPLTSMVSEYGLAVCTSHCRQWKSRTPAAWDVFEDRVVAILDVVQQAHAWAPASLLLAQCLQDLSAILLWPENAGMGFEGNDGVPWVVYPPDPKLVELHDAARAQLGGSGQSAAQWFASVDSFLGVCAAEIATRGQQALDARRASSIAGVFSLLGLGLLVLLFVLKSPEITDFIDYWLAAALTQSLGLVVVVGFLFAIHRGRSWNLGTATREIHDQIREVVENPRFRPTTSAALASGPSLTFGVIIPVLAVLCLGLALPHLYPGLGAEDEVRDSGDYAESTELSPDAAPARTTYCGSIDHVPKSVPTRWTEYACRRQHEAEPVWQRCVSRSSYTPDGGKGCPGAARCCPPASNGDIARPNRGSLRGYVRRHLPAKSHTDESGEKRSCKIRRVAYDSKRKLGRVQLAVTSRKSGPRHRYRITLLLRYNSRGSASRSLLAKDGTWLCTNRSSILLNSGLGKWEKFEFENVCGFAHLYCASTGR